MAGRNIKRKKYNGSVSQNEGLKFTDNQGNEFGIQFSQTQNDEWNNTSQISEELHSDLAGAGISTEECMDDFCPSPTHDDTPIEDQEGDDSKGMFTSHINRTFEVLRLVYMSVCLSVISSVCLSVCLHALP